MARKPGQIIDRGDGKFLVRVFLGRDGNGRRKYVNHQVHGSKKDAERMLTKVLRERDLGLLVETSRMNLDEYLDHWLKAAVGPRVREGTAKEYAATLRRYVREPLGHKRLGRLKPVDIQTLYSTMQATGLERSVRYVHTILRDALGQAVRWQMLARNPAELVDLPRRRPSSSIRALNQEEVERFLAAAAPSKWSLFFKLMLGTGVRPSEALALTWRSVDLGRGTITIRQSLSRVNGRWLFNEPKTPSSRRSIPLPHSLLQPLAEHLTAQRELGFTELLFCNVDGDPIHERGIVSGSFKPALERAGLPSSVRLYDLRHTHATLLMLAGVHIKVVSERLGHSSIGITLDTYSHVLPNMQLDAARKFDELVFATAGIDSKRPTKANIN